MLIWFNIWILKFSSCVIFDLVIFKIHSLPISPFICVCVCVHADMRAYKVKKSIFPGQLTTTEFDIIPLNLQCTTKWERSGLAEILLWCQSHRTPESTFLHLGFEVLLCFTKPVSSFFFGFCSPWKRQESSEFPRVSSSVRGKGKEIQI